MGEKDLECTVPFVTIRKSVYAQIYKSDIFRYF